MDHPNVEKSDLIYHSISRMQVPDLVTQCCVIARSDDPTKLFHQAMIPPLHLARSQSGSDLKWSLFQASTATSSQSEPQGLQRLLLLQPLPVLIITGPTSIPTEIAWLLITTSRTAVANFQILPMANVLKAHEIDMIFLKLVSHIIMTFFLSL